VPLNGLSCDCFCVCFLNGVFAFFLLPALVFCASIRRVSERGVRPASALQPPVFLWPAPPPAPSLLLFLSCCTKSSINHTQSRSHSPGRPLSSRIHYTHTHTLFYYAHFLYIYFPRSARSLASILSSFSTYAHATLCCVPCHNKQHFTFWRLFSQRARVFRQHFKDHIPDKEKLLRRILSTWDIKKSDDVVVKAFGPLLKTKNKENSTPL
jgi:hypothetical protein